MRSSHVPEQVSNTSTNIETETNLKCYKLFGEIT